MLNVWRYFDGIFYIRYFKLNFEVEKTYSQQDDTQLTYEFKFLYKFYLVLFHRKVESFISRFTIYTDVFQNVYFKLAQKCD